MVVGGGNVSVNVMHVTMVCLACASIDVADDAAACDGAAAAAMAVADT